MGKRKRSGGENEKTTADLDSDPSRPSDKMLCSSGITALCKEKLCSLADAGGSKPSPSCTDDADASIRLSNIHSSLAHYQCRRPRHHYRHQYRRRYSERQWHSGASSASLGIINLRDHERLPLRLTGDHQEVSLKKAERMKSSSFRMDPLKSLCGLCQKLLRRKTHCLGDSLSSNGEYTAVAVLVCGHIYHAECLEERTRLDDRLDPPCPMCSHDAPKVD